MASADESSRYSVSLHTADDPDNGKPKDYFDQAIALSQGIINASFQNLFEKNPALAEISYTDQSLGRLDAVLEAPSVMINGSTVNELTYIFRIKSGTINFCNGTTWHIKKWVLGVLTEVNEVSMDIKPDDFDSVKIFKKAWFKSFQDKYADLVYTEYSARRVFCDLGAAGWGEPDAELSTVWDPITKETVKFKDFFGRTGNQTYQAAVAGLLQGWAKRDGNNGIATISIKFNYRERQDKENKEQTEASEQTPNDNKTVHEPYGENELNPGFRPLQSHQQFYPYIKSLNDHGSMGIGDYLQRDADNPYGKLVDGDFNCLLSCDKLIYLSNSDDKKKAQPLPTSLKLMQKWNFCEPGIYGSYAVDHRLFLSKFLFPQLEELCRATNMKIGRHNYAYCFNHSFRSSFSIGEEKPYEGLYAHKRRGFKKISDTHYQWLSTSGSSAPSAAFEYWDSKEKPQVFHSFYEWSKSSIDLTWAPGDSKIKVSGKIVYHYWSCYATSKKLDKNTELDEVEHEVTWFVYINLQIVERKDKIDGEDICTRVLSPTIEWSFDKYRSTDITFEHKVIQPVQKDDIWFWSFEKTVQDTLSKNIMHTCRAINKHLPRFFHHPGKFMYPVSGEIEISDPKFTAFGGVIAKVEYKPLPPSQSAVLYPKFGKEELVMKSLEPPQPLPAEKNDIEVGKDLTHEAQPVLTWSCAFIHNKETGMGRLTLEATNLSKKKDKEEKLAFGFIRISFVHTLNDDKGKETERKLFSELSWKEDKKEEMESAYESNKVNSGEVAAQDVAETDNDQAAAAAESNPQHIEGSEASGNLAPPAKSSGDATEKMAESAKASPKPAGNIYRVKKSWGIDEDLSDNIAGATSELKPDVTVSKLHELEFTLKPTTVDAESDATPATGFVMPYGGKITLEVQGQVTQGRYAVKIHEAWKKIERNKITKGSYAVDWKIVEFKVAEGDKPVVRTWDVSDRLDELKAKETAASN